MLSWMQWQSEVVALLSRELGEVLQSVSLDDVDWPAWERYFLVGHSPRAAVDRAFEREL